MALDRCSRQDGRHAISMIAIFVLIALLAIDVSVRLVHLNIPEHQRIGIFNFLPGKISKAPATDGLTTAAKTADSDRKDCRLGESGPGMTFIHNKAMAHMGSMGNIIWDTILPDGGGFLFQTGNETEPPRIPYGVSMFHGLHCLQIIRNKIQELLALTGESNVIPSHLHAHSHPVEPVHYTHCLEYIAQSLMCSADGTIEPAKSFFHENGSWAGYTIDGVGIFHQCKSQSLLWRKVTESTESPIDPFELKTGDTINSIWGR